MRRGGKQEGRGREDQRHLLSPCIGFGEEGALCSLLPLSLSSPSVYFAPLSSPLISSRLFMSGKASSGQEDGPLITFFVDDGADGEAMTAAALLCV